MIVFDLRSEFKAARGVFGLSGDDRGIHQKKLCSVGSTAELSAFTWSVVL